MTDLTPQPATASSAMPSTAPPQITNRKQTNMSTDPNRYADGVLPDDVIRDPRSDGEIIHIKLEPDLPPDQLETFMRGLTAAVQKLRSGEGDQRAASASVGLGHSFFKNLPVQPAGLKNALDLPNVPIGDELKTDVVVYSMYREEWRQAEFRRDLARLAPGLIKKVVIDRGFQRPDGRELGGFHDGLRNASLNRESIVFVDRDRFPEEPAAAENGTYMVSMRITQDLAQWELLADADQEQIIGRRKSDGSRLDVAEGTPPADEPEIGSGCPFKSHVAKAGPRGPHRDKVQIFRRGIPFTDLRDDGTIEAGLHFVSYQASMEQFRTMLGEWMFHPDFPTAGTGVDELFARLLAVIQRHAVYFVPAPSEFIGSQFFTEITSDDRCQGRVVVSKSIVDSAGGAVHAELGGFTFQLFDEAGATSVGEEFVTDSTGRAVSPAVPIDATYILRETNVADTFEPPGDETITLDRKRVHVRVVNKVKPDVPNPGYG